MTPMRRLARGAVAGIAGTAALDATTYLDMAVRGRPASTTPEQTVERLALLLRLPLPAAAGRRGALLRKAGSVLGLGAGVAAGLGAGWLRSHVRSGSQVVTAATFGATALLVGNVPMTLLGVTDPGTWTAEDWAADVVPHAMYALAAAAAWHMIPGGTGIPSP